MEKDTNLAKNSNGIGLSASQQPLLRRRLDPEFLL